MGGAIQWSSYHRDSCIYNPLLFVRWPFSTRFYKYAVETPAFVKMVDLDSGRFNRLLKRPAGRTPFHTVLDGKPTARFDAPRALGSPGEADVDARKAPGRPVCDTL